MGGDGGWGFGSIEYLICLQVYYPTPGWIWSHGDGRNERASDEVNLHTEPWNCSPCRIGIAYPWFVTSILIHGSYNAIAMSLSMTGLTP